MHSDLVQTRKWPEDVALRRVGHRLPADETEAVVCEALSVEAGDLHRRRRNSLLRPIAVKMLCKYAGLTQREIASRLGVDSSAAVSHQMMRLSTAVAKDAAAKQMVERIEKNLEDRRRTAAFMQEGA